MVSLYYLCFVLMNKAYYLTLKFKIMFLLRLPRLPLLGKYQVEKTKASFYMLGAEPIDGLSFLLYDGGGNTITLKNTSLRRVSKGKKVFAVVNGIKTLVHKVD